MLSVSSKKVCHNSLSSSTAAASTIGNNCNLLIEVLYCLPVKSLCVFKTVSKQWQSLISDPHFKRNYNLRSRRFSVPGLFMKKRLILGPPGTRESEVETLVMDERNGMDFVPFNTPIAVDSCSRTYFHQSCNGLILCEVLHGGYDTPYVIYNPLMKHCKALPIPRFKETGVSYVLNVTIAFNPVKSSYFEVVCVCHEESVDTRESMFHVEIYSSKTDSLRHAGDPFPFPLSASNRIVCSGVYWNGSVHWIDKWTATLHYFDIDCELMKTIPMPTQPYVRGEHDRNIVYFSEYRGHMHLMEMRKDDLPRFDIWEMRMDYTGWNVKYYVDLSSLLTVYPGIIPDNVYFFCRFDLHVLIIEEGEDSSRLILRIATDKVISFDLKDKSVKEMYDVKPDVWVEGFEYIETLSHA